MFGLISKKKVLKKVIELQSYNKKNLVGAKYPPESHDQELKNMRAQSWEDASDNFANAIKTFLKKTK